MSLSRRRERPQNASQSRRVDVLDRDGSVDISHALGTPMSRNQVLHLAVVHAASGDRTARPVLALDGVYRIAEAKLGAAEAREPCKEPC